MNRIPRSARNGHVAPSPQCSVRPCSPNTMRAKMPPIAQPSSASTPFIGRTWRTGESSLPTSILQRNAVAVQIRFPGCLRKYRTGSRVLPSLLCMVQRRASAYGNCLAHARGRPPRKKRRTQTAAPRRSSRSIRAQPKAIRQRHAGTAGAPINRLHQPARRVRGFFVTIS